MGYPDSDFRFLVSGIPDSDFIQIQVYIHNGTISLLFSIQNRHFIGNCIAVQSRVTSLKYLYVQKESVVMFQVSTVVGVYSKIVSHPILS